MSCWISWVISKSHPVGIFTLTCTGLHFSATILGLSKLSHLFCHIFSCHCCLKAILLLSSLSLLFCLICSYLCCLDTILVVDSTIKRTTDAMAEVYDQVDNVEKL